MDAILNTIEEAYSKLSKGHRRIADYIASAYDDAAFLTAAKLGTSVGVSESTVVRFATTLGYAGYPEFQEALQELVRHRLTSVQRIRVASAIPQNEVLATVLASDMNNIRTTMELVNKRIFEGVVHALVHARRVYVLGSRSAMALAQFFSYYLDYVCSDVVLLNGAAQDVLERVLRVQKDDVCFGMSFPRYSSRTADVMRYAKSRGATLIALTDESASPVADLADYTLCARSDMASFADSLVAPLSILNAIITAAGLARQEETYHHLTQLEEIWNAEGVYVSDEAREKPGAEEKP